jgi:nucleoside-diphosphate-sugar epimerase
LKVLVTGGGGFIGAWIARRLLADGHAVTVFDRTEQRALLQRVAGDAASAVDWVCGDIARPDDVARALAGCDGVVHLAGLLTPQCRADPARALQVNLGGTLNVFEAARAAGLKRVVYSSTAGVYGPDDGCHPAPATLYGVSKLAAEGVARVWWLEHGIASVGFRPYIVYGPGREGGASAGPSLACRAAVQGLPYEIPYTGACGMVHIDDVAEAFVRALDEPARGAHAFTLQGETASTGQIIAAIRAVIPQAQITDRGPPMPIAARLADDDLQRQIPGLPHTSLARGIESTIASYRRWLQG